MKITYRQTGGYACLILGCEVDTDSLSQSEVAQLESLLEESGILQAKIESTPEARDLCNYEFRIETKEGIINRSFNDFNLPPSAEKLLDYFQQRACPCPPS